LIVFEIVTGTPARPVDLFPFSVCQIIQNRELPQIPEWGLFLNELISGSWDPELKASEFYDFMLGKFETCGFAFLKGANPCEVGEYFYRIRDWEEQQEYELRLTKTQQQI
jgi:hypothetical protein